MTPPTPSWVGLRGSEPIARADSPTSLTISDLHFEDVEGYAINVSGATDLVIERCTFATVGAAIRMQSCTNAIVRDCAFYNIMGPSGDFVNNGIFVQSIDCDGVVVEDCWGINDPDVSNPEDVVSMFRTTDFTVQRCRLWGCGPSLAGSAILLGDAGGSFGQAIDNVIVNGGQVGIGVASGENMTVSGNTLLGSGHQNANVGIYVWEQYGEPCGMVTIENNDVLWFKPDGTTSGYVDLGGCGTPSLSGNNFTAHGTQSTAWTPTGYYAYP